jgi:hypothetical protein
MARSQGTFSMHVNKKDLAAGAIFAAIGAFFAIDSLRHLRIGTALQMGPGYFPLLLSGVMLLLAFIIVVRGMTITPTPFGEWPWRGVLLVLGAPLVFALTIRGLGLVPTILVVTAMTAFASQRMRPLFAVLLSVGLTAFCVATFIWGIGLPIPILGPWISD